MHVEDVRDEHPMRFDRALMAEGVVFPCATALWMGGVVPAEVLRRRARMPIILSG